MRAGRADRAVADVVALDPGAQEEGALDPALRGGLGLVEDLDDVLEAAGGGVARLLQLADLELVLDQPQFGQEDLQLGVPLRGHLVGERGLDAGVVAAHDADRAGGLAQLVGDLADVAAGEPEQLLGLGRGCCGGRPTARPGRPARTRRSPGRSAAAGTRSPRGRRSASGSSTSTASWVWSPVRWTYSVRGPEGVLGVVGPGAQVAGGDHDPLAGEARGERGAAGGGVSRPARSARRPRSSVSAQPDFMTAASSSETAG